MKQITAIIRAARLEPVKEGLVRVGAAGMTVTEVSGFGSQRGAVEQYRGVQYRIDYIQKLKLDVVIDDHLVDDAVSAIMAAAHSGEIGDGKIWVTPVEAVYRIRTGERDEAALR
jgi:nitrogen regulatory protein PII